MSGQRAQKEQNVLNSCSWGKKNGTDIGERETEQKLQRFKKGKKQQNNLKSMVVLEKQGAEKTVATQMWHRNKFAKAGKKAGIK